MNLKIPGCPSIPFLVVSIKYTNFDIRGLEDDNTCGVAVIERASWLTNSSLVVVSAELAEVVSLKLKVELSNKYRQGIVERDVIKKKLDEE